MNGSKRVLVFVATLGSGGVERVAVKVCAWLRDAGHVVMLLTLSGVESDFYRCPDGVQRRGLGLQAPSRSKLGGVAANVQRWQAVRNAVIHHRAEVVLSLGDRTNVLMLLSTIGIRCRKIISERTDPALQSLSRGWNLLRRLSYPMANLHVSQSNYASAWIRARFPSLNCRVIGNSGELRQEGAIVVRGYREQFQFAAVGRLSHEKGIDLLLAAMALARNWTAMPFQLVVAGDGVARSALVDQVRELGLNDCVTFLGRVNDVGSVLRNADAFVIPSRWEGFPNAMLEAMASGMPVIAARCRGGVVDVLDTDGEPCALDFPPGDVEALASRLVQLMEDADLRRRLSARARLRAEDFSEARIAEAWRDVVALR